LPTFWRLIVVAPAGTLAGAVNEYSCAVIARVPADDDADGLPPLADGLAPLGDSLPTLAEALAAVGGADPLGEVLAAGDEHAASSSATATVAPRRWRNDGTTNMDPRLLDIDADARVAVVPARIARGEGPLQPSCMCA
jgi:hypothetical protein